MKKLITPLFIALIAFTSCSNENETEKVVIQEFKLEGKWLYVKQGSIIDGVETLKDFSDNKPGCSKNFKVFNSDGTGSDVAFNAICEIRNTENYNWTKNNNIIIIGGTLNLEIISLTTTELKVKFIKNNVTLVAVFEKAN